MSAFFVGAVVGMSLGVFLSGAAFVASKHLGIIDDPWDVYDQQTDDVSFDCDEFDAIAERLLNKLRDGDAR